MILKNGKRLDSCSDTVPIGTINPYIGSIAPYGYLICEGQLVSKTTYKELYEICGDKFGTGTDTEFRLPDLRGKTIAGYKEGDTLFGVLGKLIGSENHNHDISHTHGVPGVAHTHNYGLRYHGWNGAMMMESATDGGAVKYDINNNKTAAGDYTTRLSTATEYAIINSWDTAKTSKTSYLYETEGNTSYTTPSSTTTNSQSTTTSGNASNIQPTVVMNWIVKAFLLMPNQSYVENSLTSSSEINSLSAAKGKELNDKFNNYLSLNGGVVTNTLITGKIGVGIDDTPGWSNSQLLIQASQNGETKTFKPAIGFVELGTSDGTLYMRNRSLYWMSGATVSNHIPTANTGYELIHMGNYPLINDYSKETIIGYWVDGRPIYRKTIQLGANSSTNQVRSWTVGATNLNTVVDMRFVVHNNANQWRTIPWLYQSAVGGSTNNYGGADWAGGFYLMDDKVTIQLGTAVCTWSEAYFTIEYTKV